MYSAKGTRFRKTLANNEEEEEVKEENGGERGWKKQKARKIGGNFYNV